MLRNLPKKIGVFLFQIGWVKNSWARKFNVTQTTSTPWTPLKKPLPECKIALITTGGVHLTADKPFNMVDADGDPSYRKIPSGVDRKQLTITHDYYNHDDADKDINLVFPYEILAQAQQSGWVGELAQTFYSLMGHVDKRHINTLTQDTAQAIAQDLQQEQVDVVMMVPA